MKTFIQLCFLYGIFFVGTCASRAQTPPVPTCESALIAISGNPDINQRKTELKKLLNVNLRPACVVELLILPNASQATKTILWNLFKSSAKNLQQNGSTASGTSGSTNLISKNLTSHILSFASEYGAITQSTSGQTTTVNGTADGIPLALAGHTQGLFAECGANIIPRFQMPAIQMVQFSRAYFIQPFSRFDSGFDIIWRCGWLTPGQCTAAIRQHNWYSH
jgi:hypothetical protein